MDSTSTPITITPRAAVIVPPEGGNLLRVFGEEACVKLTGDQTGNSLAVILDTTPPGSGPPPHRHRNEDEMFLVVEGSVRFFANGAWTEGMPPGSLVYLPKGTVHTFQNVGDTPSRMWIIATPGGFEKFFAACVPHFATPGAPPDMAGVVSTSTEHGIEYVPPLSTEPPPAHTR